MTIQTLTWCPMPGYSVEEEPRRKVINFGNGYQQRMADGINPLLRKYSLSFKLRHNEAVKFRQFMQAHGGVKAFYFNDTSLKERVKVVCTKFPRQVGKVYTVFECEFEEVV